MKKYVLLIISIFTLLLVGCNPSTERDIAWQINAIRTFGKNDYKITHYLYIEKEYERFTWTWDGPSNNANYFYFIFSVENLYLANSDEFKYITSNDEEILFDVKDDSKIDQYEFTGPITIYIYYTNSSLDIKDIINNNLYNIEISGYKWFAEPSLFK